MSDTSDMKAEAIKEVFHRLCRPNTQPIISKSRTKLPSISNKDLTKSMDRIGIVLLVKISRRSYRMSLRITYSSTRDS
jgi:hypothetical protein